MQLAPPRSGTRIRVHDIPPEEGATVMRAGDIVIRCGTNYGWVSRSGRNCRIGFILIDGRPAPGLASRT